MDSNERLIALDVTVQALVQTHPDPQALLAVFDLLVANLQLHSAASGGKPLQGTGVSTAFGIQRGAIAARIP